MCSRVKKVFIIILMHFVPFNSFASLVAIVGIDKNHRPFLSEWLLAEPLLK